MLDTAQDAADGFAGKTAILQETLLFGTLFRRLRQFPELALPDAAAAFGFIAPLRKRGSDFFVSNAFLP